MGYVLHKLGAKGSAAPPTTQSRGGGFIGRGPALPPRRPKLPDDRRCRFEPDADAAALVDIGAFGGNAPHDIFDGQYRCHRVPP